MLGPYCHSCGMRMRDDPKGGGTYRDGAKSDWYCSECFKDGRFTEALTFERMVENVHQKNKDKNRLPAFLARWMIRRALKELKRWKGI
jgi:hypothetical protein